MIKDTRKYPKKDQKGMVLLLTFIIITTLTAIVAAFLYLNSTQLKSTGYDNDSYKALWLAEAGIQQVIYQLKMTPTYVTSPTPVSGSLGGGTYSVTVSKSGTTYILTSTGTMSGINRKIQQTMVLATAPYQSAYGLVPGAVIASNNWNEIYTP
ncbi:MAG: hypothetical protein ABSE81_03065 [Candidatus Omnitrophota bacterium]|jgi:hypothetical protein